MRASGYCSGPISEAQAMRPRPRDVHEAASGKSVNALKPCRPFRPGVLGCRVIGPVLVRSLPASGYRRGTGLRKRACLCREWGRRETGPENNAWSFPASPPCNGIATVAPEEKIKARGYRLFCPNKLVAPTGFEPVNGDPGRSCRLPRSPVLSGFLAFLGARDSV